MTIEERRKAARKYIERGAAVIPVPAGAKNPGRDGWQDMRITEDEVPSHWTNGQNVGVLCGEPSGGLVDVDLDSPEAVAVAGRFLPPTLTSGRESRPHSHWWLRCVGAESRDWKAPDGSKLVELRSTGRQTLVEPSTHPSGDRYHWHRESGLEAAEISPGELTDALNLLAAATLVARHLPDIRDDALGEGGGRHDYCLALCGFLLRPGRLDRGQVEKVLKAAWDAKGWPNEGKKREAHRAIENNVRDTAARIGVNEPVVGGPSLEESAPGVMNLLRKWWGWENRETSQADSEKESRRNQADRLVAYALEDLGEGSLFVDQHGDPHAVIGGSSPVPLNSRSYPWLRRLMWEEEQRAVNGEYLKTAAGTLAAHAEFSGEARELHTRAAWHADALYYELGPGRVVKVDADGWALEPNPPVLFRRFPNLKPLPDPETGGSAKALAGYVNLKTDRDRRLFVAYTATVPLPHVGRPILNASGAMGSGKTTAGRMVKRTWDPTVPETVRLDPRDVLQKASHAFVLMLDNQNTIPEWAADTLCRLVTGEADSKRRLYTDDEDVIIELRRAVLLNGINVPTDREDVLDRSLVVELERIPDGERVTEEELWERFETEHPKLLGALFGVLSRAMALKPSLELSRRPRLADWGEWAAAVYEAIGWGAEAFLSDWDDVVKAQNRATLDGSPVAQVVLKFMEDKDEHVASASQLHKELAPIAEDLGLDRDKVWPKSARWLWKRLNVVLPVLAAAGVEAKRDRPDTGTVITLRKTSESHASNARAGETRSGKGKPAGNRDGANAGPNARTVSNASANASPHAAETAGSGNTGNTGIGLGTFSDISATPTEFRPAMTAEQERRVRQLVSAGVSEKWARREVLAADHTLGCGCEACS